MGPRPAGLLGQDHLAAQPGRGQRCRAGAKPSPYDGDSARSTFTFPLLTR